MYQVRSLPKRASHGDARITGVSATACSPAATPITNKPPPSSSMRMATNENVAE